MALSVLVVAGIYRSYVSFTVTADKQEQEVQLNQNARYALERMTQELRMAGFVDPSRSAINKIGFGDNGDDYATNASVRFTRDITGGETDLINNDQDGQVDAADIGPANAATNGVDDDGNGFVDDLADNPESFFSDGDITDTGEDITYQLNGTNLERTDNNTGDVQVIISNVEAINFVYLDENGAALEVPTTLLDATTTPSVNSVAPNPAAPVVPGPANIRGVQVAIVIRSDNEDFEFTDTQPYNNLQGDQFYPAQNDNYRRRLILTQVNCRNLGIDLGS